MTHTTPGNWQADTPTRRLGSPAFFCDVSAPGCDIARVYGNTAEEAQANARLMASAPDLLAAIADYLDVPNKTEAQLRESLDYHETRHAEFADANRARFLRLYLASLS